MNDTHRKTTLPGPKARALIERRYDWSIVGAKLLAAYAEVAA